MLLARSLLFFLGMVLSALVIAPMIVLAFALPFRIRFWLSRQWARLNLWSLGLLCGLRYRVQGKENVADAGAIVLSKHQSAWETLALQVIFPAPVWVLKKELFWVPVFGWALKLLQPIGIDRKAGRQAVKEIIRQGKKYLGDGRVVVIFPEGTRVAPGSRGRYGLGGALLAEQSGAPVIPVAHNAGEFWRRRGLKKYPGTIQVVIGHPISPGGRSAADINAEVEEWIEGRMDEISSLK